MKEMLFNLATQVDPQIMVAQTNDGDGKKKLIVMGVVAVVCVVAFILVSKKMEKK